MSSITASISKELIGDTSPPKNAVKRLFECGDLDGHTFPSNFKHSKLDRVRKFPEKCGTFVGDNVPSGIRRPNDLSTSNNKRPKVIGTNQGQREWSYNVDNPTPKNGKACVAIAAVPLRSVPPIDVKIDSKESLASHGKDDSVRQEISNVHENRVGSREETWKHESEKLLALLAQAKEFIDTFSNKYPASNGTNVVEPEPLMEKTEDKRVADEILIESVIMQNVENLSNERMKVENGVSELVQEKKSSRSVSKYDEEDVSVLTPAEWNMRQLHSKHQSDDTKASMHKTELRGKEIADLVGGCSVNQQCLEVPDCECTETLCGEKHQESEFLDMDELKSDCESMKYRTDEHLATVKSSHTCSNDEPECYENQKELINLSIFQRDHPHAVKVREALKFFEEKYTELFVADPRGEGKGKGTYCHLEAATCVKVAGMWNYPEKPFGHIPGVEVGDKFRFRAELAVVGLHRQLQCGIDYVILDGKKFATSVVNSGRYENKAQALDVLIYSGQGGNLKITNKAADQKLEKGNLALVNSMEMGYPVRVTHKANKWSASTSLDFSDESNLIYTYDGLYAIKRYWEHREQNRKMVFKFELHRLPNQRRPHQHVAKSRELRGCKEVRMINDVSDGKEKMQIHAMNAVDNERPSPFIYITKMVYPDWFQPIDPVGCECIDGCSDSQPCPCVLKNGPEIPFNEKGAIIKAKPLVHECGPACKCPPTCMNRVSQHGPRYQLEIFKTKSRGWGVRSRNYILSGNFICEYVGELLQDKEAEQRIGDDEYLFDISDDHDEDGRGKLEGFLDSKLHDDGFSIDAAKYGNLGRFINHSCSPNLYAQEVLYDHDDKRMPHIMFFATKNIPPLQELTYDYNYKIDKVCDVNGNIKKKNCYCGSRKCTGRMY